MVSRRGVALLVVLAAIAAAPSTAAAEPPSPPGAGVACKPSAAKPEPVVLVHGTFENRLNNWLAMSPALKAAGHCVYALNYGPFAGSQAVGVYGTGPIERSAAQLRDFVDSVRAKTGAAKVDIVGHSQGGMMPRFYIRNLGGARYVDDLVGISASNKGTANPLAPPAGVICPACAQQAVGSPFITALNAGDDLPGDVSYTNVVTRYDEVVIPFTNGYLNRASNVTNVTLQDKCPTDTSEHLRTPYSLGLIAITKHALARSGPADPGFKPPCAPL